MVFWPFLIHNFVQALPALSAAGIIKVLAGIAGIVGSVAFFEWVYEEQLQTSGFQIYTNIKKGEFDLAKKGIALHKKIIDATEVVVKMMGWLSPPTFEAYRKMVEVERLRVESWERAIGEGVTEVEAPVPVITSAKVLEVLGKPKRGATKTYIRLNLIFLFNRLPLTEEQNVILGALRGMVTDDYYYKMLRLYGTFPMVQIGMTDDEIIEYFPAELHEKIRRKLKSIRKYFQPVTIAERVEVPLERLAPPEERPPIPAITEPVIVPKAPPAPPIPTEPREPIIIPKAPPPAEAIIRPPVVARVVSVGFTPVQVMKKDGHVFVDITNTGTHSETFPIRVSVKAQEWAAWESFDKHFFSPVVIDPGFTTSLPVDLGDHFRADADGMHQSASLRIEVSHPDDRDARLQTKTYSGTFPMGDSARWENPNGEETAEPAKLKRVICPVCVAQNFIPETATGYTCEVCEEKIEF